MAKTTKEVKKGGKSASGLEQLFGSKTRFSLLKLFCENPEQKFYMRELARETSGQLNAVRREITNLESLGLIKEIEDKGSKKKFYRLDDSFILLNEIKAMVLNSKLLAEKTFIKQVEKIGEVDLCVLTGAMIGEPGCQCDLLIVSRVNKTALLKIITQFEKEIGQSIAYAIFTPEEYRQRKSLTDKFLFSVFESKKRVAIDKNNEFANEADV